MNGFDRSSNGTVPNAGPVVPRSPADLAALIAMFQGGGGSVGAPAAGAAAPPNAGPIAQRSPADLAALVAMAQGGGTPSGPAVGAPAPPMLAPSLFPGGGVDNAPISTGAGVQAPQVLPPTAPITDPRQAVLEAYQKREARLAPLDAQADAARNALAAAPLPFRQWHVGRDQSFLKNLMNVLGMVGTATGPGRAIESAYYAPAAARRAQLAQQLSDIVAQQQQVITSETGAARPLASDISGLRVPDRNAPLSPQEIADLNRTLQDRYQVLNPGKPLPAQYTVPPGATGQDYQRYDKALENLERAAQSKAQQDIANETRRQTTELARGSRRDAQTQKSYQFNSSQLEKVAKPIDDAVARLGRLQDSLKQNSPQADALIAPELLTVMAGGQGSGLRMNEAEIARVVGGRSKWESLRASAQQWSLDPTKANSITPEQRQQIRALVNEVDRKLKAKQQAIQDARDGLLNSDDPQDHKVAVANARRRMTEIDQGGGGESNLVIQVGPTQYRYNGSGATDDMKNYTEIKTEKKK